MIVASMIDTIYVGWIGTLELAAVSLSFSVVMLTTSMAMGVGIGASSIIARAAGQGNSDYVRQLSTYSLLMVLAIVLVCMALGFIWGDPLYRLLGADDELLPLVHDYMFVWFLGVPGFALPMVASSIIRAVGNARIPGIIMTSAAAVQIVIAPILMFGLPGTGWEGLGFVGSAWAFVLSRAATAIYTFTVMRRMDLLSLRGSTFAKFAAAAGEVLRISIPATLANLIGPVSMAIIIRMLTEYGNSVVAAFGVASRIESLAMMILMALSSSVGPFVGQNWGARMDERIRGAMRRAYQFALAWGLGMTILLGLLGGWFVSLIVSDPDVIEVTRLYLLVVPLSYGFLGVAMIAGTTFIALGKATPTLIMSVCRMLVVYVPLALLAQAVWGYAGIFAATALTNVLMAAVAVWWVRRMLAHEIRRRDGGAKVTGNAPAN